MSDASDGHLENFIHTGRTGRRNAMPHIHDEKHANTSTGGLPDCLEGLTCKDSDESKSDTACGGSSPGASSKPEEEKKEKS